MKRILALSLGAALVLGAALALHAQDHSFHHRMGPAGESLRGHVEFMAKALDLTADQKVAVGKLVDELEAKARPLMQQHHQQWEEVHGLLAGANPDPTEVGRKMIAAHAAHEQLAALHEEFMARASALLNPDQLEKAKKFHEMHHERGRFRGDREDGR